jgi:glycosyltransferase involved in cell wall biosynthesis
MQVKKPDQNNSVPSQINSLIDKGDSVGLLPDGESQSGFHRLTIRASLARLIGKSYTSFVGEKLSSAECASASVDWYLPVIIYSLRPNHGKTVPSGLVDIDIALYGGGLSMTGKLYYRVGDTFNASDCFQVSLNGHGKARHSFYLPSGVREFRLMLFIMDSSIHHVEMEAYQFGYVFRKLAEYYALTRHYIHPRELRIKMLKQVWMLWKRGGFPAIWNRLRWRGEYMGWLLEFDTINDSDRALIREHLRRIAYQPLISILLPVYNIPEPFLRAAIGSVQKQLYPKWELCVADDHSPNARVREIIEEYAREDDRIKYVFRDKNGHIAAASNSAASLATGDFIGFLDHDDELREHALYMVVEELNRNPLTDLIYSDEDKITENGVRHDAYFKSDWNPELLLGHNCVCHFSVVRASLFRKLGGFRSGFDGAQDWDLALRIAENTDPERIRHIPHVLYHWRVIDGSTAKNTSQKPYVIAAQLKAVSEHLVRRGDLGAVVEPVSAISCMRVRYQVPTPEPLVSIIVPTRNQVDLLSECIDGVLNKTQYKNIEVVIVDNGSDDPETIDYMKIAMDCDSRVNVYRNSEPFNYSRLNNRAVEIANGEIICFLNNDIQVVNPEWLSEMVSQVVRESIGAVGAKLLFPDRTIQHVGVVVGMCGSAGHISKGSPGYSLGYYCRSVLPQNMTAVTAACMLVKKSVFNQVGGFDEESLAIAFNDVDLCLKIRKAGHLIVFTPYAELIHHESASCGYEDTPEKRARFNAGMQVMQTRWGQTLLNDPYHNPNFSSESHDVVMGWPPRSRKPWIRETEWQGIVDSYRHSTSWRITRPLRWLAGKWLALRPFVELVRDYRQRYPGVSGMLRLASRLGQAFGSGGIAGIRTRISTYVGYRNRAADEGRSWHLFQAGEYQVLEPVPDGVALEPVDLAVHLHAYYLDVLPEIRGFLAHMPCAYTLYVTTDTPQKAEVIGSLFQETGNIRKREILVTENRGRDLAPLLIDLGTRVGRHDLVLHLHTKKSPHNGDLAGWRGHLLDTLLGSDADIRAAIDCFQQNPALGLLFPVPYCPVQPYLRSGGNRESMAALLRKTGHPLSDLSRLDDRHFPAGSMFWFRKEAIRPLLAAGLEYADFAPEQGQTDGTLAHAMERLFPYYAAREGFSSVAFLPARLHVPALPGALPLSLNAVEARLAGSPCRVLFDHNEGGGVRQYAKTLMADWLASHCGVVRVFPAPGAGWVVQVMAGLNCDFYAETDRVAIFSVLSGLRCEGITVNSLFGFPDLAGIIDQIIHLADLLAAPLNYTVHDFHAICPSQHLLDTWNRYCGVPDDHKICHRCLSTNPSAARVLNPDHSIASWREPFARLLARSDTVTLFDPSALEILRRAHPPLRPGQYRVEPHVLSHFHCESPLELPRQLHIGVLGTLTEAKGANVLNALARHIRHLRRHIPISVIGRSLVPLDPTIQVLGAYDIHSLTGIVGHQHISVFFMASIIPETFSYTLSEAMAMGLPIVAFDLGAQGRRVRAYHKGRVIPPGASPGDILLALDAVAIR